MKIQSPPEGLILFDKPIGKTSFFVVHVVRGRSFQKTVGHAGTLDPFASGLLILLLGRNWTRQSSRFMSCEKEYEVVATLGSSTDTYDLEGSVTMNSSYRPSLFEVEQALSQFQGNILQTPPMYSAKKVQGKKLYQLARSGIEVARSPVPITVSTTLLSYEYPFLTLRIVCSKGTYIRSIVHDLGNLLTCFAHASALRRVRIGEFYAKDAVCLEDWNALSQDQIFSVVRVF